MSTIEIVPGIIPNVVGGLGNQMFIVSAAYVTSQMQKCPMYILQNPVTHYIANMHNRFKQDYNKTIFKAFGTHVQEQLTNLSQFKKSGYTEFSPKGFSAWNPSDVKPGTILNSYFQYWPSLKFHEQELRCLFLEGLAEYIQTVKSQYETENAAFLHVRRGDYLKSPNFHYIQDIETYYKPALEQLKKSANPTTIYILSDDMNWIKSQPFFSENSIFKHLNIENELEALALMSLCTAGAICANSTFSWWGAFLGAYASRSPVVVPKRWIGESIMCLFPEEWNIV
jgi:hypothetical protein